MSNALKLKVDPKFQLTLADLDQIQVPDIGELKDAVDKAIATWQEVGLAAIKDSLTFQFPKGTWVTSGPKNYSGGDICAPPAWHVTREDTAPERQAEILEKAADLLESAELGWVRGVERQSGHDEHGKPKMFVCARGALGVAAGQLSLQHLEALDAECSVEKMLRLKFGFYTGVPAWNDGVALNVAEVIDMFKETAKRLRNGESLTEPTILSDVMP